MEVESHRYIKHEVPIITDEMRSAMLEALDADRFTLGEITKKFETEFAAIIGTKHAVAVSSGTAALHLALLSLGVGPGDEVVMAANAYPAVADCIRLVGAVPALADVDPLTGCLDPATVDQILSKRTRAIIPLHMYGHPVDMDPLLTFAKDRDLLVVEDAAHALGTRYKGRVVGSIGDVAIFSTAKKHLMTGGIGGMVTTSRDEVAETVRLLRNHGRSERQERDLRLIDSVEMLGYNYRQSEILAALGLAQLPLNHDWVEQRRSNANLYREYLAKSDLPVQTLIEREWAYHSYLHFPVLTDQRDRLAQFLIESGIEPHFIYPVPVHQQKLHAGHVIVPPAGLPESERLSSHNVTLSVRPGLSSDDIKYTCDAIEAFFRGRTATA